MTIPRNAQHESNVLHVVFIVCFAMTMRQSARVASRSGETMKAVLLKHASAAMQNSTVESWSRVAAKQPNAKTIKKLASQDISADFGSSRN